MMETATSGATAGTPSTDGDARPARRATEDARRKVEDVGEELKERTSSAADRIREEAKEKGRELRDEAEHRAERLASSLGRRGDRLARALSAAAESLREEGEGSMAEVADEAVEQVRRMSGYLEREDASAMLDDFEELGRDHPGAFLGSAFTLGLAAGRFLRASRPTPETANDDGHGVHGASTGRGDHEPRSGNGRHDGDGARTPTPRAETTTRSEVGDDDGAAAPGGAR